MWARKLGVGKQTLASYERGKTEPTASILLAYQRAFGIRPDWLLTGAGSMFVDPYKGARTTNCS
ncbi:helix-turn-helix domain-containing protein [Rhizobium sp. TH2]|uniref:helix-turn-helix domain-containing protein n=1 Tax=Rhizobium sp. TH2 TaxID=2775403 RepID=UPI0035BE3857